MSNQNEKPKGRIDGFFLGCMAGVAAISVAATLAIGGMTGGESEKIYGGAEVPTGEAMVSVLEEQAEALKLENADLKNMIDLQKQQILALQAQILDLSGGEAELPTDGDTQVIDAYDLLNRIKAAYQDFDRETLEELIPQLDQQLNYLGEDALIEYYTILEYVEQLSNG